MSAHTEPRTDTPEPRAKRVVVRNDGKRVDQPPHPADPIRVGKPRNVKGVLMTYPTLPEPKPDAVPQSLATALAPLTDPDARCDVARRYMYEQISKAVLIHKVAEAIGVTAGDIIEFSLSTASNITAFATAKEHAADVLDEMSRQMFEEMKRHRVKHESLRCGRDVAISYRAGAEAARRYVESLMRKVSALDGERQTKKKTAAVKKQKSAADAAHDAARRAHEKHIAKHGRPLPSSPLVIGRPGSAPSNEELAALLPFDLEELRRFAGANENVAAQRLVDEIRRQWRKGFEAQRAAQHLSDEATPSAYSRNSADTR